MTLLCMGARFKCLYCFKIPWFYLNLCLHFYLYGCLLYGFLCWKMNIIAEWYLKCIFEHLNFTYDAVNVNCLFILCIIMIWTYLLYPEQVNNYSFFEIFSLYIHYLMFSDILYICTWFYILGFLLLSKKQTLNYEVPKPCYLVV